MSGYFVNGYTNANYKTNFKINHTRINHIDYTVNYINCVDITFTKYFPKNLRKEAKVKILKALKYFPEFQNIIKRIIVGYTSFGGIFYLGKSDEKTISIGISRKLSLHIIAHEFTHYIQYFQKEIRDIGINIPGVHIFYLKDIPKGEKACEIYTYARHKDFVGDWGYFGTLKNIDKNKIHIVAKKAIIKRNIENYRNYIKFFEKEIIC